MQDSANKSAIHPDFRAGLVRLIRAGTSAILVRTNEYEQLADAIVEIVTDPTSFDAKPDATDKAFHPIRWNPARGFFWGVDARQALPAPFDKPADDPVVTLRAITNVESVTSLPRAVFVMTELHSFLTANNPKLKALFKSMVDCGENVAAVDERNTLRRPIVVVVPPLEKLPEDIESRFQPLEWPLPNQEQIGAALTMLEGHRRDRGQRLTAPDIVNVSSTALGLPLTVIESVFTETIISTGNAGVSALLDRFENAKAERIGQDGCLSYTPSHELPGPGDIGGFEGAVDFLRDSAQAYLPEARGRLTLPRGSVLVGLPGTGKSLFGKCAAAVLEDVTGSRFMFYYLNISALFGSLVGQTEMRLREVFRTLKAQGKYVLMIDEMEKLLRGGEGTGDSGVASRVNAMLLTWMNDRVGSGDQGYIIGTMNSTAGVPPEFFRRFDTTFFADLPEPKVREDIFRIHLRRRNIDPAALAHDDGAPMVAADWSDLIEATDSFLGSEVEDVVVRAMRRAFATRKEVAPTVSELMEAARGRATSCLAKTHGEMVTAIRTFAKDQATPVTRPAGAAAVAPPKPRAVTLRRGGKSTE